MDLTWTKTRDFRVLDLDTECRPLSYLGGDFTTAEITAIAAGWVGEKPVRCWLLGKHSPVEMLQGFRKMWDQADMVTGHYCIRHDLPMLNAAMIENFQPPLSAKLVSDTYLHLIKRKDLSASQESLGRMFGLAWSKEHMSQPEWREANRLTPQGLKETRRRVTGDVRQHRELRARMLKAGVLKEPRTWRP